MDIAGFLTVLFSVINFILLLLVIFSGRKKIMVFSYTTVVLSIILWSIATFLYNNTSLLGNVTGLKVIYILSYVMLLANCWFIYIFPSKITTKMNLMFLLIVILLIPSIYVLLFRDNVVISVVYDKANATSIAHMGPGYLVYTLPNVVGFFMLSTYFFLKLKRTVGYEKSQVIYFLAGSVLMFLPIIIFDYFVPLVGGTTEYYKWGPTFTVFFSIFVAYSMLTKRFMGSKLFIGGFIKWIMLSLANTALISVLIYFINLLDFDTYTLSWFIVCLVFIAPLHSYLLINIFKRLNEYIKIAYINTRANYEQEKDTIFKLFRESLNIETICSANVNTVKNILNAENVYLYVGEEFTNGEIISVGEQIGYVDKNDIKFIIKDWDLVFSSNTLVLTELETVDIEEIGAFPNTWKRVLTFMKYNRVSILVRIVSNMGVNGLMMVKFPEDNRVVVSEEIKILDEIMDEFRQSIGRAYLFSQVDNLNEILKQRVDEQTAELREKVKKIKVQMIKMKNMRQRERDMLDIMGHELRTPLTIIKNAIGLVDITHEEQIKNGKPLIWNDMVGKQFEYIRSALRRELGIVETLLAATKIDADRLQVNLTKVDISKTIKTSLLAFEQDAKNKGIDIRSEFTDDVYATGDLLYMQQVVDNLLSNAIKYTQSGFVGIKVSESENEVCIEICDSGEGIGPEELKNLGRKFFRANQYINDQSSGVKTSVVRPGGTGLGLYVTFGLIKAMGGRYEVQSELGKGSSFKVYLLK
ncbi:MAG TPA: HAMP domain-containing sensor histidine kinase [Candidatus Dojkabacteria bacterium]|nr:HAMP domain-containing sensor histidine kinase [Candidatus Dojkabacteria bacterium]